MYKFKSEDTGNCRVYYRGSRGGWFCLQNDGSWGKDNFNFYVCSSDGEPSHAIKMPPDTMFDRKVMPISIE